MNDLKTLEHLAPIADEMLAGLHADENMKRRILMAARQKAAPRRKAAPPREAAPGGQAPAEE